jgi:CPA2 family monovalent cation:H+ antiporter-2
VEATILDNDAERVELLRKLGFKVYYGDATRIDLLESAGIEHAKIFVSAIGSIETNLMLAETLKKRFPHIDLIFRAQNRVEAYELIDLVIYQIYRQSLDASVRMGVDILGKLGHRHYSAYRAGQNFIQYDEGALKKLAKKRHEKGQYLQTVRAEIELQENLLRNDKRNTQNLNDHAWDSEKMRTTILNLSKEK